MPKEIKIDEHRVGLTPLSVKELNNRGHRVVVETQAGIGIGFDDSAYLEAGAEVLSRAKDVYERAEMIVKVKEPQSQELALLKANQILFTYLHLAPDPVQAAGLLKSGCIAIAYESVTSDDHHLPLLQPMSEVAGRLSIQVGAGCLEKSKGGRGVLLGGVPGVSAGKVLVIGGGVVGSNAIRMAVGMGAQVTVLDTSLTRLQELDSQFGNRIKTVYSTRANIEKYAKSVDLVVGAVLIPGRAAPKLISHELVKQMRPGSVLVDVAIDQGGCFETSHPTTHSNPIYIVESVVHYCVANMPGIVPRTSTFALTNATLPFVLALADKGYYRALIENVHLLNGLNVYKGRLTYEPVAIDLNIEYIPARVAIEAQF